MNLRSRWPAALVAVLLIVLPVLATIQYRWISQVSDAERDRLENSLRISSQRFANDFSSELGQVSAAFRNPIPVDDPAARLGEAYRYWKSLTPYPELIHALYLIRTTPGEPAKLFTINTTAGTAEETFWPQGWESLERMDRGPIEPQRLVGLTGILWPLVGGRSFSGPPDTWCLVELNRNALLNELIPGLVVTHFGDHDSSVYRIAIVRTTLSPEVLFSTDGAWSHQDVAEPDAAVNLIPSAPRPPGPQRGPRPDGPGGPGGRAGRGGPGGRGGGRGGPGGQPGPGGAFGPPVSPTIFLGEPLQLLVKHRLGSVENAVTRVRQQNLALSFGILLVLGGGIIAVVFSSLRARALSKLQMDFAAGVSHEIRTPLAVIKSAAYNLQSGIVSDKESILEYAAILQGEAGRLSDMVDQVLLYTETQSGRRKYEVEPINVPGVLERAIQNISRQAAEARCDIVCESQEPLPEAMANPSALAQCLQNLFSNAIKYGKTDGKGRIAVSAKLNQSPHEIRISISDDGPGIDKADRAHLFEPFYRGARVQSNVPGNGLGLHLVKRLMEAQDGTVTFDPQLNSSGGACFTLHIRAAKSQNES